ncbi:MAG: hypothetical protein AAF631_13650 [Pseudomonadota bacterium]
MTFFGGQNSPCCHGIRTRATRSRYRGLRPGLASLFAGPMGRVSVAIAACAMLSACLGDVRSGAPAASAPPVDASLDATTGVARHALISVTGNPDLILVVYRSDLIDAVEKAAMPARLCTRANMAVKNTRERVPYDPAAYPPGTRLMFVECA